jgi:hypothetical protein
LRSDSDELQGLPGFGIKVTPKGRMVFLVMYRLAGAGSRLRKYTIGPYGRVTLPMARAHLSEPAWAIIAEHLTGKFIFATSTGHHFQAYSKSKEMLDDLCGIRG